eukprot:13489607-Heterocapsa_arctica.AAC.1
MAGASCLICPWCLRCCLNGLQQLDDVVTPCFALRLSKATFCSHFSFTLCNLRCTLHADPPTMNAGLACSPPIGTTKIQNNI